jgi:DNA-binding MarR family transcriptional regulator
VNQLSYSLKRAFRLSAELGFSVMAEFGTTPSRFEVLLVIGGEPGRQTRTWTQAQIRVRLGVNRTTVSRFVKALESAGLVHRVRDEIDARTWKVFLTDRGRACLWTVRDVLFDGGFGELLGDVMSFVTPERRERRQRCYAWDNRWLRLPKPLEPTRQNLQKVMRPLELIREALGDDATLLYPWRRRRRRAPTMLALLGAARTD